MNKSELTAALAEATGFSKKDSEKALNAVIDVISAELVKGGKVQVVGFGTFEVKSRPARKARNGFAGGFFLRSSGRLAANVARSPSRRRARPCPCPQAG